MKKPITLSIILAATLSQAQGPDFSPVMEAEYRGYTPNIVGEDEDDLFAMDLAGNEITLECFDKSSLNSQYRKEVELPNEWGEREKLEKLSFINDKYIYFLSIFDRSEDQFDLYAQHFDAKTGHLGQRERIYSKKTERNWERGFYDVYVSKNKRSILVRTATYYKDRNRTIERLVLFNDKYEKQQEKEYITEGEYTSLTSNLLVDDEGSVYFIQKGEIVILDAFNDFEEWREPIQVEGMATNSGLSNLYLSLTPRQDLVMLGSYITEDTEDTDVNKEYDDRQEGDTQVEGMFYLRLDGLNKEVTASKLSKFEQDYIDQYRTAEHIEDGNQAEVNDDFTSFRTFYTDDGGLIFAGEQVNGTISYTNGSETGEVRYYNDIALYKFTEDGNLQWARRIPKRQKYFYGSIFMGFFATSSGVTWFYVPEGTRQFFSYTGFFDDDKFYMLFNDSEDNTGRDYLHKEMDEMKKYKKSHPVMVAVDMETGKTKRTIKRNLQQEDLYIKPGISYQKEAGSPVYFLSAYKKDYNLGKIELNRNNSVKR